MALAAGHQISFLCHGAIMCHKKFCSNSDEFWGQPSSLTNLAKVNPPMMKPWDGRADWAGFVLVFKTWMKKTWKLRRILWHRLGIFTIHEHEIIWNPNFPRGFRHIAELFWTWQAFFHRSPDYDQVGYDEDTPRSFAQSGCAMACWEKTVYQQGRRYVVQQ